MRLRNRELLRMLVDVAAAEGRSQRSIAARAGISVGFLTHLLAGRKDAATVEVAVALSRSLGISPRVLFVPASSNTATRNVA